MAFNNQPGKAWRLLAQPVMAKLALMALAKWRQCNVAAAW